MNGFITVTLAADLQPFDVKHAAIVGMALQKTGDTHTTMIWIMGIGSAIKVLESKETIQKLIAESGEAE